MLFYCHISLSLIPLLLITHSAAPPIHLTTGITPKSTVKGSQAQPTFPEDIHDRLSSHADTPRLVRRDTGNGLIDAANEVLNGFLKNPELLKAHNHPPTLSIASDTLDGKNSISRTVRDVFIHRARSQLKFTETEQKDMDAMFGKLEVPSNFHKMIKNMDRIIEKYVAGKGSQKRTSTLILDEYVNSFHAQFHNALPDIYQSTSTERDVAQLNAISRQLRPIQIWSDQKTGESAGRVLDEFADAFADAVQRNPVQAYELLLGLHKDNLKST